MKSLTEKQLRTLLEGAWNDGFEKGYTAGDNGDYTTTENNDRDNYVEQVLSEV